MKNSIKKIGIKTINIITCIIVAAILVIVNIIFNNLSDKYDLSLDLTSSKNYSPSDETVDYLKTIDKDVTINVLCTEEKFKSNSNYNSQACIMMEKIADVSSNISIDFINYVKDPSFATKYPDLQLKEGDIIVTCGDKYKQVKTEELFIYYKNADDSYSIMGSDTEQRITSAIINVTSDDKPLVTFLTGHQENSSDLFKNLLSENSFDVSVCDLSKDNIDENSQVVVISAPMTDFTESDIEKLDKFLSNNENYGKSVLFFADASQSELKNLYSYLKEWGISVDDGAVFETDKDRVYNYQPFYSVTDYVDKDYSALLNSTDVLMLMPLSKPLSTVYNTKGHITTTVLTQFGSTSGVRPSTAGDDFEASDSKINGNIPSIIKSSYIIRNSEDSTKIETSSNVIVAGSVASLDSYSLGNMAFANSEYYIKLLSNICQKENTLVVNPKSLTQTSLGFSKAKADALGAVLIYIIPIIVLLAGVIIWLYRRHK